MLAFSSCRLRISPPWRLMRYNTCELIGGMNRRQAKANLEGRRPIGWRGLGLKVMHQQQPAVAPASPSCATGELLNRPPPLAKKRALQSAALGGSCRDDGISSRRKLRRRRVLNYRLIVLYY